MSTPARNYCLTVFVDHEDFTVEPPWNELPFHDTVTYAVWQVEICPQTGNVHLQMYIELERPMRVTQVKRLNPFLRGAHFEKRKGTQAEAVNYCRKEESRFPEDPDWAGPFEHGTLAPGQGSRSDLHEVVDLIQSGATLEQVAASHGTTFVRNHNGLTRIRDMCVKPRDRKDPDPIQCEVYFGAAGTGKSHLAFDRADEFAEELNTSVHVKMEGKWWDGYTGQKVVIFDDFDADIPHCQFLRIVDKYPLKVEVKGSSIEMLGRRFIITANKHPREWWPHLTLDQKCALRRRITKLVRFTGFGVYQEINWICEAGQDSDAVVPAPADPPPPAHPADPFF